MQETDMLKIYIDELKNIEPLGEAEIEELLERLRCGDYSVRDRLTEGNLHFVVECVLEYQDYGASVNDLIQEGNIALLDCVKEAQMGAGPASAQAFLSTVSDRIRTSVQALLKEDEVSDAAALRFAREANDLLSATREFEEREGRPATIDELVKETGIPADSIEYLIRVSQSAMDINPGGLDSGGPGDTVRKKNPFTEGWEE